MERKNYVITAILTVMAAVVSGLVSHRQPNVRFIPRLDALPMRVGDWRGQDSSLDQGIRDALSADSILCRDYMDSGGRRVSLLITYRKYGRRGFTHRPELCYPAAGWEIISADYARMPYAGRDVEVHQMEARRDGSRALVTYWFASGRRTEASYVRQQISMALDRLRPQKYGWAFIRADVIGWRDKEEALDVTSAFMGDMEKPLTRILTGSD